MEITTFSYAKLAVISPEWMWRSAAQFYCFTLKIAPFSTETVGNDIYWATGENVVLPCFSDASYPVLQFLGWWGLTLPLLKRLAISTCWRQFFTVWFWPSGYSILIYLLCFLEMPLFMNSQEIGFYSSAWFKLTKSSVVFFQLVKLFPSKSFGFGTDHSSQILLCLPSIIYNLPLK